jgi:hypothetical protein
VLTVRINASDESRQQWGWRIDPTVDHNVTETGLDSAVFDLTLTNAPDVPLPLPALQAAICGDEVRNEQTDRESDFKSI